MLKYDIGDYFLPHIDRYNQDDDRYISGGIELSNEDDFKGGEFVVKNIKIPFERGKLINHKLNETNTTIRVFENDSRQRTRNC